MKNIYLAIISLIISFNAQAEIENKAFLSSILLGCVEEEDENFSAMFSVGEQIEFCGCYVNSISKNMDTKEVLSLGFDMLKEGDGDDAELNNDQLQVLMGNKNIEEGLINCMIKVIE